MGAARAYGDVRHGHQIMAVGEVPAETLRLMVDAITPK
jgi:negative regulator of sigma E activity